MKYYFEASYVVFQVVQSSSGTCLNKQCYRDSDVILSNQYYPILLIITDVGYDIIQHYFLNEFLLTAKSGE